MAAEAEGFEWLKDRILRNLERVHQRTEGRGALTIRVLVEDIMSRRMCDSDKRVVRAVLHTLVREGKAKMLYGAVNEGHLYKFTTPLDLLAEA